MISGIVDDMAAPVLLKFLVLSQYGGAFLQNCLDSIEHLAPECSVEVIPSARLDASADGSHPIAILETNSEHDKAASLVCLLRDDMQLVRPVTPEDVDVITAYYQENRDAWALSVLFMQGSRRDEMEQNVRFDLASMMYAVGGQADVPVVASTAGCVMRSDRLKGRLDTKSTLKQLCNPFAACLPSSPGATEPDSWARRRVQARTASVLHRIRFLDEDSLARFVDRDFDVLPFSEDFLICEPEVVETPWCDGKLNRGMMATVHRLERFVQRIFKRAAR